ncbi:MAG TPA: N-formylglutamate amidohydrolase [Polyangia bacterium]|jgi:N-formylglutamate amidohydrolase|nr:N-formylglutamate amidohydrolase [Polyangia bacterium]
MPSSPLVLSVPHAGTAKDGFEAAVSPTLDVRTDADLFVDRLYGVDDATVARGDGWGGPFVAATLSRFVCDMNRDADDVSPQAVPDHPRPTNADGRGFIWAVTTNGTPALARPLALAEWQARQAVHAAYHGAIADALALAKQRFGFAVLLDGHSMPGVGRAGHKDPGRHRADIVPGDRDGTSCSPSLSSLVKSHFETRGFQVAFNEPYKGGFITAHHGRPHENIHAIQIELRRDLYMDEAAFAPKDAGFARLQTALRELLAALESFRP